jgi:membrane associated rhomboid family serine protease
MKISREEKRKIFFSLLFPFLFVALLWIVKAVESYYDLDLGVYGILPREIKGLSGIFLSPLIHGDLSHLINNSIPLLILGSALYFFYKPIAWRVFILSYFLTSIYTWISARYNYHIGASGLVYSLFAFLLLSGFIRRHIQLIAISFLVAFLYGSLVWGVLPWNVKVSWEGHFWGFFVGIILSIYYRKEGPQRKVYVWEEEEEEINEDSNDQDSEQGYWISDNSGKYRAYDYRIRKEE